LEIKNTFPELSQIVFNTYLGGLPKKEGTYTRKARNSNLTPRRIPKPDCLKIIDGTGKVFHYSTLPRFLERKIAKLNQKVCSWHSLRHLRASMWANSGMPLIEIMHRLGHSNISTTQGYLQLLGYKY